MKPNLYIMCGMPFSGKSTLAREVANVTSSRYISFDAEWERHFGMPIQGTVKEADWNIIHSITIGSIREALKSGESVVYDDLNHVKGLRDELRQLAESSSSLPFLICTVADQATIEARMKKNTASKERHDAHPDNVARAAAEFEPPRESESALIFNAGEDMTEWINNNLVQRNK